MTEIHGFEDVMSGNIEMKKVFTVKQVLFILAFSISVTSAATSIYYRFQYVESQIRSIESSIATLDEKANMNREDINNMKRESLKPTTTLTKPSK